jgi:hypothetical protein
MTMSKTNGQIRKSLGDQIDRLDAMLNGLAEGLSDAVARAVKDAVGAAVNEAVQVVLREALTSPELLVRLQGAAPAAAAAPAPAAYPPAGAVAKEGGPPSRWATAWKAPAAWLGAAGSRSVRRLGQARRWAAGAWARVRALGPYKYRLLAVAGVGVAVGAAACLAGPRLAAMAGPVSRLAANLGLQAATAGGRMWAHVVGSLA